MNCTKNILGLLIFITRLITPIKLHTTAILIDAITEI